MLLTPIVIVAKKEIQVRGVRPGSMLVKQIKYAAHSWF